MRRYHDGVNYIVDMDSVEELTAVGKEKQIPINVSRVQQRQPVSTYWAGGSRETADDVLRNGWPEGVELVEQLAQQLSDELPAPRSFRRKPRWADEGDEPSWEREQAGQDFIWRTVKRENTKGPAVINVVAPWGGSVSRHSEQLMWNGVVMVALVKLLEQSGYRVGLRVAYTLRYDYKYFINHITVKRPEQPLDIASLVPVLAHPAVYRHYGIETAALAPWDCGMGFGAPSQLQGVDVELAKTPHTVFLQHAYGEHAAKQEVQRVLTLLKEHAV